MANDQWRHAAAALSDLFLFPSQTPFQAYEELGKIGEGTYGTVLRCRHKGTGEMVAVKRFKESGEENQVRAQEREGLVEPKREGRLSQETKKLLLISLGPIFAALEVSSAPFFSAMFEKRPRTAPLGVKERERKRERDARRHDRTEQKQKGHPQFLRRQCSTLERDPEDYPSLSPYLFCPFLSFPLLTNH